MTRDGTPRIVGGHDALLGDNETTRYPYLVSLQTTFPSIAHRCGGSLIGKRTMESIYGETAFTSF